MKRRLLTIVLAALTLGLLTFGTPQAANAFEGCESQCAPTNIGQPLCACGYIGSWLICNYTPPGQPCGPIE